MVRDTQHTSPPVEHGHLRCCTTCNATFRTDFERCPLDGGSVVVADVDPLIGSTVGGHYEIEALIGIGAMGRVYRAHHTRLVTKRYALKVLFGELTASATMRMRFAHEAESASKLEHPNIVGVLDFGCTEAGLMYLVMDLVEGPTLGAMIDQGPMEPPRVIAFARQMCAGLAHAHARGIVHRDFKPDNILVSGDPGQSTLRIADFGLAISVKDDDDDARLTASGVLCTPTYAAPEQLLGKDIDQRADLYALGVTMYEMLTGGVLPFARGSQEVMLWKVTTEWPAVSGRAPKAPPALAELIRRLLVREPSGRPDDAAEVVAELDRIAALPERSVSLRMPSLSMSLLRVCTRRWPALVAGAAAVIAVIGVALDHVGDDDSSSAAMSPVAAITPAHTSQEQLRTRLAPSTSHEPAVPMPPDEVAQEAANPPAPPRRHAARAVPTPVRPQPAAARPEPVTATPAVAVIEQPPRPPTLPVQSPGPAAAPPRPSQPSPPQPQPAQPPPSPPRPARAVAKPQPPRIAALDVTGAIATSVVRRGVERALPSVEACMDQVGARVVAVSFAIEELRRATHVRVSGPGAQCITAALGTMRVDAAPDVGEVTVDLRLSFTGKR